MSSTPNPARLAEYQAKLAQLVTLRDEVPKDATGPLIMFMD